MAKKLVCEKAESVVLSVLNATKQNMGLKKFQIVFDNPWSTYYSGQPVTGRLLLTVDSPKKIRGMLVVLSFVSACQLNKTMLICPTLLRRSNDVDKVGGPFRTHGIGKRCTQGFCG